MTLLSRIHQLHLKAVSADEEDRIKSRSGEFTTLRERLQSAIRNASRTEIGRKELRSVGIVQDGYLEDRALALAIARDLRSCVDVISLDAKFDEVKAPANKIEVHFKKTEKFVADAWRNYASRTMPTVDEELLAALERGGVDVGAIHSSIENAESALLTLRNRTLPESGDIAKLQNAISTLNSTGERISELIDPVIANVVVLAQGDGVPYSELTPEVISALRKLGILERFRMVLK